MIVLWGMLALGVALMLLALWRLGGVPPLVASPEPLDWWAEAGWSIVFIMGWSLFVGAFVGFIVAAITGAVQ